MKQTQQRICVLLAALPFFLISCSGVFTHSLATWAQRDPESLVPAADPGNVVELVETAENDPDMSLVVLRRIAESGSSGEQVMQDAALQAAANAANITNTILKHLPGGSSIDESEAVSVVTDAIAGMRNLSEAAEILLRILPSSPADEHAFDAFDPADLAMAAIVILSAEAAAGGDVEGYLNSPVGPGYEYAKKMAKSAGNRYAGDGSLGAVLDGLHLQ